MMTLVADLAAGDSASEFLAICRLINDNGSGTKSLSYGIHGIFLNDLIVDYRRHALDL